MKAFEIESKQKLREFVEMFCRRRLMSPDVTRLALLLIPRSFIGYVFIHKQKLEKDLLRLYHTINRLGTAIDCAGDPSEVAMALAYWKAELRGSKDPWEFMKLVDDWIKGAEMFWAQGIMGEEGTRQSGGD